MRSARFKTGERVLVIAPPNVLCGAYRNGHEAIVVSPPPSDEIDSYCIRFDDGTEDYYFETWLKSMDEPNTNYILQKIRQEIETASWSMFACSKELNVRIVDLDDVLEIIDKHMEVK